MRKMLPDSILDLGKCPNRKTNETKLHVLRLGLFARSKIETECIFLIKYYIITIINDYYYETNGAFWPIFNKVKNGFPIAFSDLAQKGLVFFLHDKKLI